MTTDHRERLQAMVSDRQQTWDLSPSDVEAIRWALSLDAALTAAEQRANLYEVASKENVDLQTCAMFQRRAEAAEKLLANERQAFHLVREELEKKRQEDNPELDATGAAHPAWWRGHDHTTAICAQLVQVHCGPVDDAGVCNEPWESARRAIKALRQERDDARNCKPDAWEHLIASERMHAQRADCAERLLAIEQEKSRAVARECGRLAAILQPFGKVAAMYSDHEDHDEYADGLTIGDLRRAALPGEPT